LNALYLLGITCKPIELAHAEEEDTNLIK
jgi:hypothetical protein